MKSACIITSIFPPTSAVASFADSGVFETVIVVGDRKSPDYYHQAGVRFISLQEQEKMSWRIVELLPRDHYARKMVGYLEAAETGAHILYETDDDNHLVAGRSGDIWHLTCNSQINTVGDRIQYVNIYRHFTSRLIWPRGLPLDSILESFSHELKSDLTSEVAPIAIWQGLADGDPDVDAIYRLTINKECSFDLVPPVTLAPNTICPFNSQNTAFKRDLLPLMYLPAFVSFRFTDILRSFVAQPILWAAGLRLCFTSPTVFQKRNPHNYIKDFESEVPMYLHGRLAVDTVAASVHESQSISENLFSAYRALERQQIVPPKELTLLEAWLADCDTALDKEKMNETCTSSSLV